MSALINALRARRKERERDVAVCPCQVAGLSSITRVTTNLLSDKGTLLPSVCVCTWGMHLCVCVCLWVKEERENNVYDGKSFSMQVEACHFWWLVYTVITIYEWKFQFSATPEKQRTTHNCTVYVLAPVLLCILRWLHESLTVRRVRLIPIFPAWDFSLDRVGQESDAVTSTVFSFNILWLTLCYF